MAHATPPSILSEWLSNTLKEMGIDFYGSFHLLRHSCATHLVENGADIKIVQQLLGHENLETTGIYTDVAIKHLSEAYHRTHPSSIGDKEIKEETNNVSGVRIIP